MSVPEITVRLPLFPLGQVVGTPAAIQAMARTQLPTAEPVGLELLKRHVTGDWEQLDPFDRRANHQAVANGLRVLSVYQLADGVVIWLITEADRSRTTFLLPHEY